MFAQGFVSQRPAEGFDVGVLVRLAGLDEAGPDSRSFRYSTRGRRQGCSAFVVLPSLEGPGVGRMSECPFVTVPRFISAPRALTESEGAEKLSWLDREVRELKLRVEDHAEQNSELQELNLHRQRAVLFLELNQLAKMSDSDAKFSTTRKVPSKNHAGLA